MQVVTPHCCEEMTQAAFRPGAVEDAARDAEARLVVYVPHFREYGLPIYDGGSSYLLIKYCPWCGTRLPVSTADEYFDAHFKSRYES